MKTIIISLLTYFISNSSMAQQKDLTVTVSGLNSNKGVCRVYVFKDKKGFPTDAKKALKTYTLKIASQKCSVIIEDLIEGEYAIAVLHDENSNGKLDTNFLGIPNEGTGSSNNPVGDDGPPSYSDAKFKFKATNLNLNITIKYL